MRIYPLNFEGKGMGQCVGRVKGSHAGHREKGGFFL